MGQSESQTKLNQQSIGQINIQINKTSFQSGEQVNGLVFIDLNEQLKASCLLILLEGTEETSFMTSKTENEQYQHSNNQVQRRGINKFHELKTVAYKFSSRQEEGKNIIGSWKLPFQLVIADHLPSSFSYFESQNLQCQIKYILKACILDQNSQTKLLATQEIQIIYRINQAQNRINQVQQISNPLICFCCLSGSIEMSAQTDKKVYEHLEEIKILLNCDASKSFMKVHNFIINMKAKLSMRSNENQHFEKYFDLYSQTVDTENFKINNKLIKLRIPQSLKIGSIGYLVQYQNFITITPSISSILSVKSNIPLEIPFIVFPATQRSYINASNNQSNLQIISIQMSNASKDNFIKLDLKQQQHQQMPIPQMINPQQDSQIDNNHYTPYNLQSIKQFNSNQEKYHILE